MKIKAFKGFRPQPDKVALIASRPYDVLSTAEARVEAQDNPYSFLNVVKPEITLGPDNDPYSEKVYQAGKYYFQELVNEGIFFQDQEECLYVYELTMSGRVQTGFLACASVDDYQQDRIKKHELTRPDKELDRVNHIRVSQINAEPVFLAYRAIPQLDELARKIKLQDATYDFTATDGVRHRLWMIRDAVMIKSVITEFSGLDSTYVADGHHRTAAAAKVGLDMKTANPNHTGEEEYNYFLAAHFPDDQLCIMDYNRVVSDLNGLDTADFLERLEQGFTVQPYGKIPCKPGALHVIGMYLAGCWYQLQARTGTWNDADPIGVLDVTLLSEWILKPLLGIHDLRTDKRIDFVGGIRGLEELERLVDNGEAAVAFAMYPVSMHQLMAIADSGRIMPPKVTWFEPKLRSGLVVHSLRD